MHLQHNKHSDKPARTSVARGLGTELQLIPLAGVCAASVDQEGSAGNWVSEQRCLPQAEPQAHMV